LYLIKNNGGNYMGESRLHYGMSLRLYFEEKAFGPGMVMLLQEVERTGSLQKAAKAMNMAYSKAWKMLKGAEKEWGFALTDRETGGKDGGGSTLTPQAERLIEAYEGFKKDAVDHLDQLFAQYFSEEKVEKIKGME
jgi:molybdate transport system regulatory protein